MITQQYLLNILEEKQSSLLDMVMMQTTTPSSITNNIKPQRKFCEVCLSETSRVSTTGYYMWTINKKTGQRQCYSCMLKERRKLTTEKNRSLRCTSPICMEAREKYFASEDYSISSFCRACMTSHSKENKRCPCCSRKMRNKPLRANSAYRTKVAKPLVYY